MTSSPQTPNANAERNLLRYTGQNYQFVPAYARNRDPTTNDLRDPRNQGYYSLPSVWINTASQEIWVLVKRVSIQNGGATWVPLSGGAGSVIMLQTDIVDTDIPPGGIPAFSGTVSPNLGAIRISGDNGIKSVSTFDGVTGIPNNMTLRFISGEAITSDGGGQSKVCLTQGIPSNSSMTIQIVASGYSQDNLAVGAYGTCVVKNVSGTSSVINSADLIVNKESALSNCNVTVTASGTSLQVNVIGQATKTINWTVVLPGISVASAT